MSARAALRAALFALVGMAFFGHWVLADPGYDVSETQDDWGYVLGFSAAILSLAFALPLFAQLAGGPSVFRVARVAAVGAALSSLANIVEDGLHMDWAFFAFILGSAILVLGLAALTVAIAFGARGDRRLLALVPAGTLAAIVLYVVAGGVVMLVTWLGAAALALATARRAAARQASSCSSA